MKLWLLRPIHDADVDLWEPWYDKCFGFVIRASTESAARAATKGNFGDESYSHGIDRFNPWLDKKYSTCVELKPSGKAGIIIRDFASA